MQDHSKIFYKTIGNILYSKRLKSGIKYTDLCYENDIPMSSYDVIIKGTAKSSFYNIARVVKATKMSFEEFGALLDKELPEDFWNFD